MSRNLHNITAASGHILSARTVRLAKVTGAGLVVCCLVAGCGGATLAGAIVFFHVRLEFTDSLVNVLLAGTVGLGLIISIGIGLLMLSFAQDIRANAAARRRWSMLLRLSGFICLYVAYNIGLAASALTRWPLPVLRSLPPLGVEVVIGIFTLWGTGIVLILAGMVARMIEASSAAIARSRLDHPTG
jgi:hypothetical protein